jgi:hypothetical protein
VTLRVAGELDRFYCELQSALNVTDGSEWAGLVVPNGNGGAPVHRWFRMKEAYSCELIGRVLDATGLLGQRSLAVCDPFCGSGTSGVSVAQASAGYVRSLRFTGIEVNPYLHLVSQTKLAAIHSPPAAFPALAQRMGAVVAQRKLDPAPEPRLSTFSDERFFDRDALIELLRLRAAIDAERERGTDPLALDLAAVCLGSIVESVSRLRRDGRALRHEPDKSALRPLAALLDRASEIEEDLQSARGRLRARVHHADARTAGAILRADGPFDLVVFSPPYPNNIDYTEVYKLEAWLLGFYQEQSEFSAQRHRTLRSHASLDFGEAPVGLDEGQLKKVKELLAPLLRAVPEHDRYAGARRRTIQGYACDMLAVLHQVRSAMAADGQLVYVVGNSLHGGRDGSGLLIAADLLIAKLAELAGFTVTELAVARVPSRRRTASSYLRESVVFARANGPVVASRRRGRSRG